jgi:hypothetical protein
MVEQARGSRCMQGYLSFPAPINGVGVDLSRFPLVDEPEGGVESVATWVRLPSTRDLRLDLSNAPTAIEQRIFQAVR